MRIFFVGHVLSRAPDSRFVIPRTTRRGSDEESAVFGGVTLSGSGRSHEVWTNISCVSPSSRADGVTIVFGPMKIFSFRASAVRTSYSLTNSATLIFGASGFTSGVSSGLVVEIAGFVSYLEPAAVAAAYSERAGPTRSATICAATSAGLGFAANRFSCAVPPREIPRATKTSRTILAIVRLSGTASARLASETAAATAALTVSAAGDSDPPDAATAAVLCVESTLVPPESRCSAGTVRCSTGRDSQAIRLIFIKCIGPMLSEVMFPPAAPQPSVIAGNKFVE